MLAAHSIEEDMKINLAVVKMVHDFGAMAPRQTFAFIHQESKEVKFCRCAWNRPWSRLVGNPACPSCARDGFIPFAEYDSKDGEWGAIPEVKGFYGDVNEHWYYVSEFTAGRWKIWRENTYRQYGTWGGYRDGATYYDLAFASFSLAECKAWLEQHDPRLEHAQAKGNYEFKFGPIPRFGADVYGVRWSQSGAPAGDFRVTKEWWRTRPMQG